MVAIFITILVLTMTLVGLKTPYVIQSRHLRMFRVLFPSWRFFESVTPTAKVYYRTSTLGEVFSNWQELQFHSPTRSLTHLWHNPDENLRLNYCVQLEQLINDLATLDPEGPLSFTDWPSYRIVMAAVIQNLRPTINPEIRFLQIKIGAIEFAQLSLSSSVSSTEYGRWSDAVIFPSQEI